MSILVINPNLAAEIIDSESPTLQVFTPYSSQSVITFLVANVNLTNFINEVLGSATLSEPAAGFNVPEDVYVRRKIPASHPIFPYQYASKIVAIKGYNPDGKELSEVVKQASPYKDIRTNVPPFIGDYNYYKVTVQFESRQYNVYTDEDIDKFDIPDTPYSIPTFLPNNELGEEWRSFLDRPEYLRYTNIEFRNEIEYLTFGNGNYFAINDVVGPRNLAIPMNNDLNYQRIVKQKIQLKWYFVPFQVSIDNYHWLNCYSRINALPFYLYEKGELLFDSINVDKYEPYYPFNTLELGVNSTVGQYFSQYNKNQYCDVTFNLIEFVIPPGRGVRPDVATYKPFGWKDVDSAHNKLLWYGDLKWYYFETATNINKGRSLYYNYPFELLFNYRVEP